MVCNSLINFHLYLGCSGLYTIAPESFPTHVRSTGYGLVCIMGRIGGISGAIVSGLLLSASHGTFMLLCLYGASIICCGLLILTLKETREFLKKIESKLKILFVRK